MQATTNSGETLPSYRVYMVRCWQESNTTADATAIWRFSLDAPWYQERRGFANLDALMEHLQVELMEKASALAEPAGNSAGE